VARLYLVPDRLSIVLVGNASAFTSQLRRAGVDRFEIVDLANLDLTSPDFKRPAAGTSRVGRAGGAGSHAVARGPTSSTPSPLRLVSNREEADPTARARLEQVIAAKGGLTALRGIRSLKAVTSASVTLPGGHVDAETTTYLEYPNHVRVETKLAQGTQIQVYDGERAWVRDPSGTHELSAGLAQDMEASLRRDTIAALLAAARGDLQTRLLPDVVDETGTLRHALEVAGPKLDPLVMFIDPDTNLVAKQTYVARAPDRPLVEEIFSDYRLIAGVQVAFGAEVRRGGQSIVKRRLREFVMNPAIESTLFRRPTS